MARQIKKGLSMVLYKKKPKEYGSNRNEEPEEYHATGFGMSNTTQGNKLVHHQNASYPSLYPRLDQDETCINMSLEDHATESKLKPSAPPLVDNYNTDVRFKLSVKGSRELDKRQVMMAFLNLQDDYQGDFYLLEILKKLIPIALSHMFENKAKDQDHVFKRTITLETPIGQVRKEWIKPNRLGASYIRSHNWITPTKGRITVNIHLIYKSTRTPGPDLSNYTPLF